MFRYTVARARAMCFIMRMQKLGPRNKTSDIESLETGAFQHVPQASILAFSYNRM